MANLSPAEIDACWNFGDPAGSERRFRALLPRAAPASDAIHAELLTQLARAVGLQRRFDEARALLEQATALAGERSRARVRLLLERGRVARSSGEGVAALPDFQAALTLAEELGEDALAVDAMHMVALVVPPAEGLAWHERALALADASADPGARRWRGSLLNNLGWAFHDLGRYGDALAIFQQLVVVREEQGDPREVRVARWMVGRALRSLGRLEEALALQQENLALAAEAGDADGYIDEEIGECLLALGRGTEARAHFRRAAALLGEDDWLAEHEPERLARLRALGDRDADG